MNNLKFSTDIHTVSPIYKPCYMLHHDTANIPRVVFVLVTSGERGGNYSNFQWEEINIPAWNGQ